LIERKFIDNSIKQVELTKWLTRKLESANFSGVEIKKTPLVTRVVLKVERPGLVIGRKGASIQQLTEEIEKRGIENPQVEIAELGKKELDPQIMANVIAGQLERGMKWRRVLNRTVKSIIQAGALGTEVVVSGKIVGKGGKSRVERVGAGYMKKAGDTAKLVKIATSTALPKAGAIGVTVKIVPPDVVFSDKINLKEIIKANKIINIDSIVEDEVKSVEQAEKMFKKKPLAAETGEGEKAVAEEGVTAVVESEEAVKPEADKAAEQEAEKDKAVEKVAEAKIAEAEKPAVVETKVKSKETKTVKKDKKAEDSKGKESKAKSASKKPAAAKTKAETKAAKKESPTEEKKPSKKTANKTEGK